MNRAIPSSGHKCKLLETRRLHAEGEGSKLSKGMDCAQVLTFTIVTWSQLRYKPRHVSSHQSEQRVPPLRSVSQGWEGLESAAGTPSLEGQGKKVERRREISLFKRTSSPTFFFLIFNLIFILYWNIVDYGNLKIFTQSCWSVSI